MEQLFHAWITQQQLTPRGMQQNDPFQQLYFRPEHQYHLSHRWGGIYFTCREAQIAVLTMMGKTAKQIGRALKISPRTVEYYLENMKRKVSCRCKKELIAHILRSRFMQNLLDAQ